MSQDKILGGLKILDKKLVASGKHLEIHMIGGMSLFLHGINMKRETQDIDSVLEITDEEIINLIHEVGEEIGLDKWFDFGASSISIPENYQSRLIDAGLGLKNLEVKMLSLEDIVKLKVVAYYNRSANGEFKDYEDLKSINPNKKLIEEGIVFLKDTYSKHLPEKFKKEFLVEVELIRNDLEKI
jgi:hypothetical protein